MTLCTNKELLNQAKRGRHAAGAFNVKNLEILQAAVSSIFLEPVRDPFPPNLRPLMVLGITPFEVV